MKTTKLVKLIALLAIVTIFSCKKDDVPQTQEEIEQNLETTGPLYLRFEINGDEKEYSSNQGFWGGGSSINGNNTFGTLSGYSSGDVSIDFSKNQISLADLLALEGKTIPFGMGDDINAGFSMNQEGVDAASNQIENQESTSLIKVVDAYDAGENPLGKLVRITGTFACQMREVGGSKLYEVSNGEFSLIFQEVK